MKEKSYVVLTLSIVIAMVALLFPIRNKEREYKNVISDLEAELVEKVENVSKVQSEHGDEISQLKNENEKLREDNKKLTEELASTFLTNIYVQTKSGYESGLFLHDSEETAKEKAIIFSEKDKKYFFMNFSKKIELLEVLVNDNPVEDLVKSENHAAFSYEFSNSEYFLIKIKYLFKGVEINKYLRIFESA